MKSMFKTTQNFLIFIGVFAASNAFAQTIGGPSGTQFGPLSGTDNKTLFAQATKKGTTLFLSQSARVIYYKGTQVIGGISSDGTSGTRAFEVSEDCAKEFMDKIKARPHTTKSWPDGMLSCTFDDNGGNCTDTFLPTCPQNVPVSTAAAEMKNAAGSGTAPGVTKVQLSAGGNGSSAGDATADAPQN
jgi:hypothetical protein